MKSKVSIGVDYDNQPIIRVELDRSSDVRDQLVENFWRAFGSDYSWARFKIMGDNSYGHDGPKVMILRPISPDEMESNSRLMTAWSESLKSSGVVMREEIEPHQTLTGRDPRFAKGDIIETGGDYYKCLVADSEIALFGKITQWRKDHCTVSYEITMMVSNGHTLDRFDYAMVKDQVNVG